MFAIMRRRFGLNLPVRSLIILRNHKRDLQWLRAATTGDLTAIGFDATEAAQALTMAQKASKP
jgi:hypothetical protein